MTLSLINDDSLSLDLQNLNAPGLCLSQELFCFTSVAHIRYVRLSVQTMSLVEIAQEEGTAPNMSPAALRPSAAPGDTKVFSPVIDLVRASCCHLLRSEQQPEESTERQVVTRVAYLGN